MIFFDSINYLNRQDIIEKDISLDPYWYKYAYVNLFSTVGAHIGHTVKNTVRQSAWMIYGFKWDLAIINLALTVSAIKAGFSLACGCASKNRPFWFVTQDKTFYRYSRYLAIKCGDFLVLYIEFEVWRLIIVLLLILIFLDVLLLFLCVRIVFLI